ncbi:metallopeptidase family protein [Williamsia sterculiae]|uniref:Predicted Zn-dependent protease, minimal metalloprotease (MMP)-like domain n=1 Tax=Williamsia sterculiae TaxID=1344003 RepID=A0A1N7H8Y4_9NOCA|nr:metallopeptidase family protein [Williamsia sterculiae]SIS21327.1 Predicted Zn-dependent protease, minimal metalloprotease (MMP)-like domain [Williamsia sterculiae]
MPVPMSDADFESLVADALDQIPEELTSAMSNVVVLVEPHHESVPDLLGLYHGIALTDRDTTYGGILPDTITIYRDPLLAMCDTPEQVVAEVAITVVHEIAHHFGIDDDWLHAHGWG